MTRQRSGSYVIERTATSLYISNRLTMYNGTWPVALFIEGTNGDYDDVLIGGFIQLAALGVCVASLETPNSSYGNDTAMTAITAGVEAALTRFGHNSTTGKVAVVGASGGSTNGINWAIRNPTRVNCACFSLPVVDLDDVVANNRGGFGASVTAAYGGAVPDDHNPIEQIWPSNVPMRLYASGDDNVGVAARTAAYDALFSNVDVVTWGNVGHSLTDFPSLEACEWVLARVNG